MEFGICLQGVIPVRAEPSHKSEMVTQVLFGELCRIILREGIWCRVQLVYDQYEGWIHHLQVHLLDEAEFLHLEKSPTPISLDLVQIIARESHNDMLPVPLGSSLPGLNNGNFTIDGDTFRYEGEISNYIPAETLKSGAEYDKIRWQLTRDAMLFLNAPYLWGGRTPLGIDCSGLVQMIYKLQHIQLLRDASQQATQGEVIHLLFEALPADLVFFDDEEGNINHAGMLLGRNSIIHCSGQVRIDHLDQEGIFNRELMKYTHKLRLIKRIF
jgi:hypothetical protein